MRNLHVSHTTRLLGELEHLKIETRLIDEMFPSVMGEYCVFEVIDDPSIFKLIREIVLTRVSPTFVFRWTENVLRRKWKSPLVDYGR